MNQDQLTLINCSIESKLFLEGPAGTGKTTAGVGRLLHLLDSRVRARAIIPCTEDDLTNLAIALDARELKPGTKVVMRMFDAELAKKVERGFGIHTAFSTSALAAPAFAAAATQADISHSFYVGDTLLNVSQMTVRANSHLVGKTLAQLERELDLSVIMHQGAARLDLHPAPEIVLATEDCIVVFASLDTLNRLQQLNRP